jgi:predicted PurR-regulated permease PerM
MPSKIEISHKTILFTIFILAAIWVVFQISDILFLLFIAFIIMSGLRPIVDYLTGKKIPRVLSVVLTYGVFVGLFVVVLLGTVPTLVIQSTKFIQALPSFITRVMPNFYLDRNALTAQIAPLGENIVKVTVSIFSNLVTTLAVFVFAFYFLLERKKVEGALTGFVGADMSERLMRVMVAIEQRLGSWVLGEFFLMIMELTLLSLWPSSQESLR